MNLHENHELHDHEDRGPSLVAMALVVFFAVIAVLFTLTAQGADAPAPSPVARNPALPDPNWKPPVAPEIVPKSPIEKERSKAIADKWGVEIISLNISAAGYMMDFRFRVLDVEKSKIFFDHRIKPLLLVEKSNAKLPVPMAAKVGAFRPTNRGKNIKPNKIYYIVFGNPDSHVKSGEKVSLLLGDEKIDGLTVH